jgi:hypothetical protein
MTRISFGPVRLDFLLRDLPGHVDVNVAPVDDREAVGAWPAAYGLPACEATVSYPGQGYNSLFGWVQLVRSTDNSSGGLAFEMDPFDILGNVSYPFGFFGIKPTLFDAPSRSAEASVTWTAHSFLIAVNPRLSQQDMERILKMLPEEQETAAMSVLRVVRALVGFSWGFTLANRQASILPAEALDGEAWNAHLPMLAATYPDWTFTPDLHG